MPFFFPFKIYYLALHSSSSIVIKDSGSDTQNQDERYCSDASSSNQVFVADNKIEKKWRRAPDMQLGSLIYISFLKI